MDVESSVQAKVTALFNKQPPTIHDPLGIVLTKLSRGQVQATMPVDDRTKQPFGLLHGGASVVLAESCASIGAWLNIDDQQYQAVGVEINANHLRAVRSGIVTATATPLHLGKRMHVWNIVVRDEKDQDICVARCTLAIIEQSL